MRFLSKTCIFLDFLEIPIQSLETHLSDHYNIKMGCMGAKNFCQISYCYKESLAEVCIPAFLGYRNNAKSRISKIDKQYFNLISMEVRRLFWCKDIPFCLKDEFLSFNWEISKILKKVIFGKK